MLDAGYPGNWMKRKQRRKEEDNLGKREGGEKRWKEVESGTGGTKIGSKKGQVEGM